jgi:O-acetylhomoserine (thiol)-lyase
MFNDILPQMGIKATFCRPSSFTGIAAAIDGETRAMYAKTVANPSLQITDLDLADVAKAHGAL